MGIGQREVEVAAFGRSASAKLKETADFFIDLDRTPRVILKNNLILCRKVPSLRISRTEKSFLCSKIRKFGLLSTVKTMQIKKYETNFGGKKLSVEISDLADQANGSVLVRYGGTVVFATVVMSKRIKERFGLFSALR